ncbi:MAG: hypothetical protein SA378_10470 [Sedimentibacter sp.]|uniref:hypothetical protein n=1 Tax=Sedimentibacter sp. TaxID=1960295 RepID=UPI002981C7C3|nr:hypothetical protein [Sedimentibacter sp.]MDW5300544.1 hypothetical protein [Sedimentibacter sp.]
MDRLNLGDAPNTKKIDDLSVFKMKMDGQYSLSSDFNDKQNPNINILSKKENTRMENKSIVNNKPSQFGPVLGVNFHNLRK